MLLQPRWIVRHLIVVVVVSLCCLAGFWQIHRLHERQAHNRQVRAQMAKDPVDLDRTPQADPYRRIVATGRYDRRGQILLRSQVLQDTSGNDVLTPLMLPNGHAVLVDRGWVPLNVSRAPGPPEGIVRIEGLALPPEHKRPFSPDIPPSGRLSAVSYVNVGRIAKQVDAPLLRNYVLLSKQRPAGKTPLYEAPPELTDGPHRGYALQWFLFMAVGIVGYAAYIRRARLAAGPSVRP